MQASARSILLLAHLWSLSCIVFAATDCIKATHTELGQVDAGLLSLVQQQVAYDRELAAFAENRARMMAEIGAIMGVDPAMTKTMSQLQMIKLRDALSHIQRERVSVEGKAYRNNDELIKLRDQVPVALQRTMRLCLAELLTDKRRVSNFGDQGLALIATAEFGISVFRKAAYIAPREMLPRLQGPENSAHVDELNR